MKPDFMDITAKLIAEVSTKTCIDTEVIEELLKDELIEYHNEVLTYGHNLEKAVERAYNEGYADGLNEAVDTEEAAYSRGFEDGRAEAESDNEAYTKEAVESAYNEGYALGYYEGRSDGHSEGYSDGYSAGIKGDTTT